MSPPSETAPSGRGWLQRFVDFREGEGEALLLCWAYFFALMCGYSILKPLRDTGISGNVDKLPWSFTGTFVAMLVAVPLFSALISRYPRRRVIPLVYQFFFANLLVFVGLMKAGTAPAHVARAFFIWASVYNLFVVSVFWSFMADLFSREQAKRLFGFIAAGGTAGAIVGPALTALLVKPLGAVNLLFVSAALLQVSALCVTRLSRWARSHEPGALDDVPVGGGMLAGLLLLVRSPYLLGLGAQTLLYTSTSTLLYFFQLRIVAASTAEPAQRTALFAAMDLAMNALTLVLQCFITGRVMQRLGLAVALGIIPTVTALGFLGLAAMPALGLLVVFKAVRGAAHYALERPAREVLFTVVDREEKYKSKSFIDTVVYRGSDTVSSWFAAGIGALGLGLPGLALAAVPLSGAWLAVSTYLARRQEARVREVGAALPAPRLAAERAS